MAATEFRSAWNWRYYQVAVNCAADAQTELVAAVTGKVICVLSLIGTVDVNGHISLESAADKLTGVMPVSALGGFVVPRGAEERVDVMGYWRTAAGEALNMTTVTCVFDGSLVYAVEDDT